MTGADVWAAALAADRADALREAAAFQLPAVDELVQPFAAAMQVLARIYEHFDSISFLVSEGDPEALRVAAVMGEFVAAVTDGWAVETVMNALPPLQAGAASAVRSLVEHIAQPSAMLTVLRTSIT